MAMSNVRSLSRTTNTAIHTIAKRNIATNRNHPTKISFLDLRRSKLSVLERLVLEEALLRHDPLLRSWAIIGSHEPVRNDILKIGKRDTANGRSESDCVIVLGIGGKPHKLLDLDHVRDDDILCVKRFSGGGTVVIDKNCLLTTFIGRTRHFKELQPYPREIMKWSADVIFDPAFKILASRKRRNAHGNAGPPAAVPEFSLRENDYVLGLEKKMAGNAQSIVKDAWLHHTSFLWDYEADNMKYLTLPEKRPEYRGDRNHGDFLEKLSRYFDFEQGEGPDAFFDSVRSSTNDTFDVEEVSLEDALRVVDDQLGGMQSWFDGKCRTKVMDVSC